MVKLVVTLGFLVAFSAGLVVGLQTHTSAPAAVVSTTRPTTQPRGGFLPAALNLTPEQQEKMKQIWANVADRDRKEQFDKHNQCRKERDEAILALLSTDQKTTYDDIQKTFRDKNDAIDREMRAEFDRKVEETNEILTPEQRVKYAELRSRRQPFDRGQRGGDRNGGGDHGGFREQNRRGDDRATSQPRSQP